MRVAARVAEITQHAPGLRTLVLEPQRTVPRFKPGQFLQVAIDPWDPSRHWPESRAFSIASPPEERDRLEITVSAVGPFTRRMMELDHGAMVWVKLPLGEFVVESQAAGATVLVAGGTGVTPFVSLLRQQLPGTAGGAPGRLALLYGARRPELLVYRSVAEAAARRGAVELRMFCEEGESPAVERGRLTVAAVHAQGAQLDRGPATYYLSGPPAMVASLRDGLQGVGVEPVRIRVDAWA